MTSDAPPLKAEVEVELFDFQPVAVVRGRVVRQRAWEESLLIPGIGIEFNPETIRDDFRTFITSKASLDDLLEDA